MGLIVNCELCGGKVFNQKYFLHKLNRKVVQCQGCDLVFVNPQEQGYLTFDSEDRSKRQEKYESLLNLNLKEFGIGKEEMYQQEVKMRILHFKNRIEKIKQFCSSGELLDVGCARGQFLASVPKKDFRIFGVEPRWKIYLEAKDRLGDNIFCGTLKEACFNDSRFNVVTMFNLIEHIPSPREMLLEVNRILKPGGYLVLETPDLKAWWPRLLGSKWHQLLVPEHHFFFSKSTITKLLGVTGFDVINIYPVYKLVTLRFLVYLSSWHIGKGISSFLVCTIERLRLADIPVRFRQPDAMLVFARRSEE